MHFDFRNILSCVLRFILGGIFIFSGLVKLYPIEPFELTFIDIGISTWQLSPFFARFIIAAEIFIGLLLVLNIKLKNFTLKAAFILLLIFSIYIIYLLILEGNDANCGCLGSILQLTPVESLIKNIVLLGILFLLMKKELTSKLKIKITNPKSQILNPKSQWITAVILLVSCAIPFILNPVQLYQADNNLGKDLPYALKLGNIPNPILNNKSIDLSKGKKILAFLLVNCPHCKNAAYKLAIANKKYDLPEIYFIFRDNENDIADFMKESKSDFPYVLFNEKEFFKIINGIFPTIMYLEDSNVHKHWTGKTLTYSEIEKFSDL